ncbi:MAG: hypothetical protein ABSA83_09255 [Verrucomicrobiota bacterium]|jgi:hypothetical protein
MNKKPATGKVAPGQEEAKPQSYWSWLLLGLLVVVYMIGFYFDVRRRDAVSWMDPYLYHRHAAFLAGTYHGIDRFTIPTLFPYCIVPFLLFGGGSIAAALWVNVFFFIVLCLGMRRLCQQFEITVSSTLVTAAVLSSPLLIGLSRELYIEFALTAICAWVFGLWFDSQRQASRWRTALFAAAFGFGFMMKMTFPIFFAGPFLVAALSLVKARQYARLFRELAAFCVPVVIIMALTYLVSRRAFAYYFSVGNTTIPIMKLIGPGTVFSAPSLFYYVSNIWKTMLFLLTPLLLVALLWGRSRAVLTDGKAALLWGWLAGPMLLLTLIEVKEPRHIAPCVVPAVLLLFRGLSAIRPPGARQAMSVVVLAASLIQYLLVTNHVVDAPYYLDGASRSNEILEMIENADPGWKQYKGGAHSEDYAHEYAWKRTKNMVLRGFDPNMALLLAWRFQPMIVFDLDLLKEDRRRFTDVAYNRFEDLFYFAAFNLYNRRCLCHNYFRTLEADTALDNADYLLVCLGRKDADGEPIPGFHLAGVIGTGAGLVQVLVADKPRGRSYRALYAREFLRSGKMPGPKDLAAIYFDLAADAALRGDLDELNRIFAEYPLKHLLENNFPAGMRNIYWIDDDTRLMQRIVNYLCAYTPRQPETEAPPK